MLKKRIVLFLILLLPASCLKAGRTDILLDSWNFQNGDPVHAELAAFDDGSWKRVTIPHDWAIAGPFDKEIDKQVVRIEQNNEKAATEKTGRTGSLPFIGTGWYRTKFDLPETLAGKQVEILFEGAMSNAQIWVNGKKAGVRPYGYSYFTFDITPYVFAGKNNQIAVRLENQPFSSRWYPGAGLYRNVTLSIRNQASFSTWGTSITTPYITDSVAQVRIRSEVSGNNLRVKALIRNSTGKLVATRDESARFGNTIEQSLAVSNPQRWSPESPNLYTVDLLLYENNQQTDSIRLRFGIRSIRYSAEKGFELNGKVTKFKGVCLHHDLGPLGAAVNTAALRRQLTILKDMGCNAIRSSHNMPSFEQLDLCDEMGFLFLAESFDEWKKAKVQNGYHQYFDEWSEPDVVNLVRATRNHPCIVMWSAGNEVPDQSGNEGVKRLHRLQSIFHREDPTRPVTVGMDQVKSTMESGFGAVLDIPGLNYRLPLYEDAYKRFPQGLLLGSETASTVSSRGVYKFPVVPAANKMYPDGQCSSYDVEYCSWSNLPDDDFALQDDKSWVIGEFVWTGFDYLGEPTPYDNQWPSRSSYFGICDLAGIPKDRYFLYRSRWNTKSPTLHILPHWNWKGREGQVTPVFVYTSFEKAELFVNGKSQGVQIKDKNSRLGRYRLLWNDVKYTPGSVRVVAYDSLGRPAAEETVYTAGKPHHLLLEADRTRLNADGKDLSFITVSVVDKSGRLCPDATNQLRFTVRGAGIFKAACNGDATSLEQFQLPAMKTFSGKLVVLIQSTTQAGSIQLTVQGAGLKSSGITLQTK